MKPRLLYFVSEDWYFRSHRLPLALAARDAGWEVHLLTRVGAHRAELEACGITVHALEMARAGRNPLGELRTLWQVIRTYARVRPALVHQVAMKPVLYGCLAARLTGVQARVSALAGLGYVFSSEDRLARLIRPGLRLALRLLLGGARARLILQNPDDEALLRASGLVRPGQTVLIRGSGVDVARYRLPPPPAGLPLVVLPARLLRDKGVFEFVEAARQLRAARVPARFALVGEPDPENPASVTRQQMRAWARDDVVGLWGWREDMVEVLREAAIVCLPSWREGLPKALLEAAAAGRAIVTCDVPGCREVVRHEEDGLLVPVRDPVALAAALQRLIGDPALRARLGAHARARAEAEFSIAHVVRETLALYDTLCPR